MLRKSLFLLCSIGIAGIAGSVHGEETGRLAPPPDKNVLDAAAAADKLPPPVLPALGRDALPALPAQPGRSKLAGGKTDDFLLPGPPRSLPKSVLKSTGASIRNVTQSILRKIVKNANQGKQRGGKP